MGNGSRFVLLNVLCCVLFLLCVYVSSHLTALSTQIAVKVSWCFASFEKPKKEKQLHLCVTLFLSPCPAIRVVSNALEGLYCTEALP